MVVGNSGISQILCFVVYHADLNIQKAVEVDKPGATIIPVIISSDKTQVTLFRNKSAYPVYMTIGNLPKSIRRKPSRQGQILLAYLPTSRLLHIDNKSARRRTQANMFHACMSHILAPLREAGTYGIRVVDGKGFSRRGHPILAVYVGDYPEQILVTGAYTGDCARCDCPNCELGNFPCIYAARNLSRIHDALQHLGDPDYPKICLVRRVSSPYSAHSGRISRMSISSSQSLRHSSPITPRRHETSTWMDHCCMRGLLLLMRVLARLPPNHSIHLFKKGINIFIENQRHGASADV